MTAEHTLEQTGTDATAPHAVREGQLVPVTCVVCGCRLEAVGEADAQMWFHYGRLGGRDARGDRVPCIDAAHDAEGRAALAA
jgi:hypothetical protein